jgi:hypothetical protein
MYECILGYRDDSSAGDDDARGVGHLALAVARDARVVADVLVPDVADAQFGAVVEDAHGARRLHGVCIFIPKYFGRGRALRLTVEDNSISCKVSVLLIILFFLFAIITKCCRLIYFGIKNTLVA